MWNLVDIPQCWNLWEGKEVRRTNGWWTIAYLIPVPQLLHCNCPLPYKIEVVISGRAGAGMIHPSVADQSIDCTKCVYYHNYD